MSFQQNFLDLLICKYALWVLKKLYFILLWCDELWDISLIMHHQERKKIAELKFWYANDVKMHLNIRILKCEIFCLGNNEMWSYVTVLTFIYLIGTSINILWKEYSVWSPSLDKLLSSYLVVCLPYPIYFLLTNIIQMNEWNNAKLISQKKPTRESFTQFLQNYKQSLHKKYVIKIFI